MNLVEKLGGYQRAKDALELPINYDFSDEDIKAAMLEHRRQHNIFEVGDKVVLKRPDQFSEIYTYDAYSEKLDLHFFESENDYGHITLDRMRHATPEEIQAGHRL